MRVVVIGSKGMLGFAIASYFKRRNYDVLELSRFEFDIAQEPISKLSECLSEVDAVINCAGVIKPMIASTTIEDVLRVNAIFPKNLAKICIEKHIRCFHITTDCVYSGSKGSYTEADLFDADDIYGMSKNAGESTDVMVLRTSIIGEERGQARSFLEWAKSQAGKQVYGFTNHRWNGMTTPCLAEVIETICKDGLYHPGIFHLYSAPTVNKYELLTILNEVYALNLEIQPTDTPIPCDRSLDSIFDLSRKVVTKLLHCQIQEMREFFRHL